MNPIPNYLRAKTNKYKGDVAEEIALEYLKGMGYTCKSYGEVATDLVVSDASYTYHVADKTLLDSEIKKLKGHLKRFKESQRKYHSKVVPKGLRWEGTLTWEDYRKRQLESGEWHIENVVQSIRKLEQKEEVLRETWGKHLENLQTYIFWLVKECKHKPRYPDFIALKEDEVYVIEVKSQTMGKTAFFSEYQKEALQKASDFGLKPILLTVPVDISIEIGEPKITAVKSQA